MPYVLALFVFVFWNECTRFISSTADLPNHLLFHLLLHQIFDDDQLFLSIVSIWSQWHPHCLEPPFPSERCFSIYWNVTCHLEAWTPTALSKWKKPNTSCMIPFRFNVQNRQIQKDRKETSGCQGLEKVGNRKVKVKVTQSCLTLWDPMD